MPHALSYSSKKENKMMKIFINAFKHKKRNAAMVFVLLTTGFLIISSLSTAPKTHAKSTEAISVSLGFNALAEKVSPAVVNIRTVKTIKGGGPVTRHFHGEPWGEDHPFKEFFRRFYGDESEREYKQRSLGSGFIIDKSGYIVTNNHVIESADQITVKLKNAKEYDAEIVGRDPNTDLALLKIKAWSDVPVVELGNSDDLKVGDWVVAIGSPFGLEHTVTAGIVSAKGRVIGSGPYDDFIQTDASINPGNSGGPLINMKGKVVGINTAIVARGQGIGFAVPVNMAKDIIEQLKTKGEVTRGWLGVAIQDIGDEMSDYYGLKDSKGVLVADVFKGDPADEAGIQPQDIILEVNGKSVETTRELTRMIAEFRVGEFVKVKVLRTGQKKTFKVKIAKREDERLASRRSSEESDETLGIRVSNIAPEISRRFNMSETQGVIVVDVVSGSIGDEAGVQAGDVIKEINHQVISTVDDYKKALKKVEEGDFAQMFIRRKDAGFLVIKVKK